MNTHAIVWIDHQGAKVYRFDASGASEVKIHSHTSLQHLHHRPGGWEAGGNLPDDGELFARIAETLDPAADLLVTGPGNAKSAFKAYLERRRPDQELPISILETTDHPGDDALLALGRAHVAARTTGAAPVHVGRAEG